MVSLSSRLRQFVSSRSFATLLLIWSASYFAVGAVFAAFYKVFEFGSCTVSDAHGCVWGFLDLFYFSFTTQATVGYGDFLPVGLGRGISVMQTFVGMTMNAVLLGIVVFKALKRSTPIVFPDHLVYELEKHCFWFRFMNVDPDVLRNVTVKAYVIRPLSASEELLRKSYDTLTSEVSLPFSYYPDRPTLNLTALRTVSNQGKGTAADEIGDFKPIVLSPVSFQNTTGASALPSIQVALEVTGYFHTNGDTFFASKIYDVQSIRCGRFVNVNNHEIANLSLRAKSKFLSRKLDATVPSSAADCVRCPYHTNCVFDVAVATRQAQGKGP